MSGRLTRVLPLLVTLGSVLCLSFFYLLDRIGFSSSHFSPIFQFLLIVDDPDTAWMSLAACLLALIWSRFQLPQTLAGWCAAHPALLCMFSIPALSLGAVFVYHACPFSMDEYAAVFQAKIFAAGHLFAQLPPALMDWFILPGFNGSFLIGSHVSGQVIEGYWPGFALLLAPFSRLGVSWLCNPMLSACALWVMYRITVDLTGDRRAGGWAVVFALASGAFVLNGISFYSMQAHLLANLLFARLMFDLSVRRALLAGVAGSFALTLHNPFPHALFALPWLMAMLFDPRQRRFIFWVALGYLPLLLCIGGGWFWLRIGLLPGSGVSGAASAVVNGVFGWPDLDILNMRAAALAKMWVWAVPGLFVFAAVGAERFWLDRRIRLFTASLALTFGAYLFVHLDQGHGWGFRYVHSAWGVVPIMAGCALARREGRMPEFAAFAGATALLGLVLVLPLQLHQTEWLISHKLEERPAPRRPGNNVYFIDWRDGWYTSDRVQFDPFLRDPDLVLAARGASVDEALIRRNWPQAQRVARGFWGEQWYLGPQDHRRPSAAVSGALAFDLKSP